MKGQVLTGNLKEAVKAFAEVRYHEYCKEHSQRKLVDALVGLSDSERQEYLVITERMENWTPEPGTVPCLSAVLWAGGIHPRTYVRNR
ncbi:MAG: hypothetical protein DRI61_15105 [Chloroflexi bacterium]|nr:MAG: hypothetical protein DRI61_15105 [Chloroflexota bacterium]